MTLLALGYSGGLTHYVDSEKFHSQKLKREVPALCGVCAPPGRVWGKRTVNESMCPICRKRAGT